MGVVRDDLIERGRFSNGVGELRTAPESGEPGAVLVRLRRTVGRTLCDDRSSVKPAWATSERFVRNG
jgi:hypothetical protein